VPIDIITPLTMAKSARVIRGDIGRFFI
jgi:hypothetical protein